MLCVLLHVFQHELFDSFLQFLNPALNHDVFLMDVHEINILGWDWVQIGKLPHQLKVAVAFVRLVLLHFSLFEHHVGLCLKVVFVKSKIVYHVNSEKDVLF